MKVNNTELRIVRGDITKLNVDAIVNATDTTLAMKVGLASVIKKNAREAIEDEAIKKGPLEPGQVAETKAGALAARYVIHALIRGADSKTDEVIIRNACRNSLILAQQLELKSIAFPALGCGVGDFPVKAVAKIMAQEVFKHCKYDSPTLEEIVFVLYDDKTFNEFRKQAIDYLEHIQNKLSRGPFITVDIIIEVRGGIVLIERLNPPFGWAIPGGFVDYGETLEDCAIREAREETGLDIYDLEQMHTYSDPKRDPRFHTITTVFVAKAKGSPKAADDAKNAEVVTIEDMANFKLAFDHLDVLEDYKRFRKIND